MPQTKRLRNMKIPLIIISFNWSYLENKNTERKSKSHCFKHRTIELLSTYLTEPYTNGSMCQDSKQEMIIAGTYAR